MKQFLTDTEARHVYATLLELAGLEDGRGAQQRLSEVLEITPTRVMQIRRGYVTPDAVAALLARLGDGELEDELRKIDRAKYRALRERVGVLHTSDRDR